MSPKEHARKKVLLLVEDDRDLRHSLLMHLESANYFVIQAEDGAAAVKILDERAAFRNAGVTAVISDWNMPVMEGPQLLNHIRHARYKDLPFVMISGTVTSDQLNHLASMGADSVLLKPFSPQKLIEKIEEAIARRAFVELQQKGRKDS
jgi:two-component system, chemotaxis family, chemotaxis protein CheY